MQFKLVILKYVHCSSLINISPDGTIGGIIFGGIILVFWSKRARKLSPTKNGLQTHYHCMETHSNNIFDGSVFVSRLKLDCIGHTPQGGLFARKPHRLKERLNRKVFFVMQQPRRPRGENAPFRQEKNFHRAHNSPTHFQCRDMSIFEHRSGIF